MTKKLPALAVLLLVSACRAAFAPEPVTRLSAPPEAELTVTVATATELRRAPSKDAPAVGAVEAGASVQASSQVVHGFRRVKLANGQAGYVDASVLGVTGGRTPAAPAAQ